MVSEALSPWESGRAIPFPPQDSVVRVNLSHLSCYATDTVGRCPLQALTLEKQEMIIALLREITLVSFLFHPDILNT